MKDLEALTGQVLIAIPNTAHHGYVRGVMLITSHWPAGSAGIIINRPIQNSLTVGEVMRNVGISFNCNEPIFMGGPDDLNKIQVVHSLDWHSSGTKHLNDQIGLTSDISILAALSEGKGPRFWRFACGQRLQPPGEIEGELIGEKPWIPEHRWLTAPATEELVFNGLGDEQWINAINESSKIEVASWF